jgi:hypothetical protein
MKQLVIVLIAMFGFAFSVNAQTHYKKDGTPDMRYKENKQMYGNSYSQPSYSQPTYSQPTQPTYKQPTYSQPTYQQNYSQPTYSTPSTYPTYPTKKDGTPDMRYKENKQLYGNPYSR